MIESILFPESLLRHKGLKKSAVRGLGKLVCLAGPNGCGKSRILEILPRALEFAYGQGAKNEEMQEAKSLLRETHTQSPSEQFKKLDFAPSNTILDYWNLTDKDRDQNLQGLAAKPPSEVWAALGIVLHRAAAEIWNSRHPDYDSDPTAAKGAQDARTLTALLGELLDTKFEVKMLRSRPTAHLFGRELEWSELSDGQKLLIAWGVSLHRQAGNWKERILLLDEPDAHLHPDACITAIDRVRRALGENGQMWIATHSLPIIAYAGLTNTYFITDGRLERGGPRLETQVERLLGGEDGRERLHTFLRDAHLVAASTFALESLLPPGVASHRPDDKQEIQLVEEVAADGHRILDYAAGRGRFAVALEQWMRSSNHKRSVDYVGYNDPDHTSEADTLICEEAIRQCGGTYVRDISDVKGKFDQVVLCNTLHEVPPTEWENLFERIALLLRDTGELIIMEDQVISAGEMPHDMGFIVLEKEELEGLFDACGKVDATYGYEGRLSLFRIGKGALAGFSVVNLAKILHAVADRARTRITDIRQDTTIPAHRRGRLHMFYSLLHSNAMLAIETVDTPVNGGSGSATSL